LLFLDSLFECLEHLIPTYCIVASLGGNNIL
jgi:hypothetical protein